MKNPPQIKMETLTQEVVKSGFLGIDRRKVKFTYPDNSTAEMIVDAISKNLNDAVAIIAHYKRDGVIFVYLRSCLRPPLGFRNFLQDSGRAEAYGCHNLFELPAGLVDKEEFGYTGLIDAARRELHEEVGIDAPIKDFKQLGPRTFSSVGMTAERIFYFEVEVDPDTIGVPLEDGSALEKGGEVIAVPLTELVNELLLGNIADSKTQMGIMRLALACGKM
jgi:8-oxo-dGTP pyrophosphatase MutT (NUDIX family)